MKEKEPEKIEVHKIDIKIGDKTISLKPEQLRELKKILNEMFEDAPQEIVKHEHHYHTHQAPYYPIYVRPSEPTTYPYWTVTCSNGGIGSTTNAVTGNYTNTATLSLNAA